MVVPAANREGHEVREIGSIFSVDSYDPFSPLRGSSFCPSIRMYSLCREALFAFLAAIDPERKIALLPAYTCSTVIDPFEQLGWEVSFYSVHEDLSLNLNSVLSQARACRPSVAVFHPYYGMDYSSDELDAIESLKKNGCITIEDVTQSLLAPKHEDAFACRVGSIRKWFPVPDGGFLDTPMVVDEPSEIFDSFYVPQLVAMRLREKYFDTGDPELKALSIRLNKCAVRVTHGPIAAHAVSDYTLSVLDELDMTDCLAARLSNFRVLLEGLVDCARVKLPICDMRRLAAPPLYFPVYVNGDRGVFQSEIAEQSIYAPVLWMPASQRVLVDDTVRSIYDHILAIPCDQRYSTEDMERIVKVIESL